MSGFGVELGRLMAARGIGVRELARRVPCNPGHVSNLRNGKARPSPELAGRLDDLLEAGGSLAGLVPPRASQAQPAPAAWDAVRGAQYPSGADTLDVPCRVPDGRIIFVTVPRRLFLQRLGKAAAGVSVSAAMPLVPVPEVPGGRPAERFLLARKALRDSDNLFGPREVIPLAIRQVSAVQQAWRAARGSDRRDLLEPQVQFADLLGWLYQDCGELESARYWLDRALEWSHVAGDHNSAAFILARKSQLAGDMRDPAGAIAVAEAALKLAGRRSRLGAVAATYASYGYALAGDRPACDRLCDQARSALDGAGGSGFPWAKFLDQSYIDVHHARSLAALGDHRAAAARFREAIDRLQPDYYRDRGVYLAREAGARAGAGELEHAASLGLQALAIGAATRSGRIFGELAGLEPALRRAAGTPAVARFTAAMDASVLRSASLS